MQGSPGPRRSEGRVPIPANAQQQQSHHTTSSHQDTAWLTSAQSVSWWDVHEFVAPLLAQVGSWPIVGTPAWCNLADDHPAKIAALYSAAEHWALRVETCQQAECDASHDVSAAEDWGALGRRRREHREWLATHPWGRRMTS